jgi:hypothetical protein
MGVDIPPKRGLIFNGLHGVVAQKIELFVTTAVRSYLVLLGYEATVSLVCTKSGAYRNLDR